MQYIEELGMPVLLDLAISEWTKILGTSSILVTTESINKYARSSGFHSIRSMAILFPSSTSEVSQLAKVANKFKIAIYPISKGKNWGYGDACPPSEDQVIVDLSKMCQILEFNEELGYAVLQP